MNIMSSPFFHQVNSVSRIMFLVNAALLPLIAVKTYWFGEVVILQCLVAIFSALLFEGLICKARNRAVFATLTDGSALLTALLIALSLPVGIAWWINLTGVFFAIVVAKHLYGGLGQNPFNPAMVAFAVCIISFPAQMAQAPAAEKFGAQKHFTQSSTFNQFRGNSLQIDSLASATPLDNFKTQSKIVSKISNGNNSSNDSNDSNVRQNDDIAATVENDAKVWRWLFLATLLGGVFLLVKKLITWQIPVAFLASMSFVAAIFWLFDPSRFASPIFHLLHGGTMLGAFFIATDPVTSCRVSKAQLIYGCGCGLIAYLIRSFAAYPDGVAFAVLLMNITVTTIDSACKPAIFGMKKSS